MFVIWLKLIKNQKPKNLIKLLKNNKIQKIFHYARFDVAVFKYNFKINIKNIYCTKIASKLVVLIQINMVIKIYVVNY